ncbi:MAG: tRNA pseudouridine(38-40) synthase TruA [Eubacteriales bacterium]
MKILLEIAYMGSHYHGYQTQNNEALTVQRVLQNALEDFFGVPLKITGCSRTDAGVHAKQFYCTVEGEIRSTLPPEKIPLALRPHLPEDIAILTARSVREEFHPRYLPHHKEYEYNIYNAPILHPYFAGRAWHCPVPLDVAAMNAAAAHLVGRHDFAALMAQGSAVKSTVREIHYCDVRKEGDLVIVRVAADGFLYNMVRIIAGTLTDVGKGKISPDEIPTILSSLDRTNAGPTLPPEGLYLNRVVYPEDQIC